MSNETIFYVLTSVFLGAIAWFLFYKSYLYRRIVGGKWVLVWYNRWNNGGSEVWEKDRPGFDWESVGGRVLESEG